jgi:rSAM/selenodomain-associated transferase 2
MENDNKNLNRYKFSIIVPVLNETDKINPFIEHLRNLESNEDYEIIVVDGNPVGRTISAINYKGIRTIIAEKGRAKQMNAGAYIARGEILIFLHVDTLLPVDALSKISKVLKQRQYIGGAFDLGIGSEKIIFKIIAYFASIRSRLTRIPYGDQAIFIRKDYFNKIGGYQEIPLMEDVELMHRIKKERGKICILSDRVITSPRRWEKEGIIYCTLRNWVISIFYFIGVSPNKLTKFYYKD